MFMNEEETKAAAKSYGQNLDHSMTKMPSTDFQQPVIQYLIENANGRQLLKLMKLNKWFIPTKFKLNCDTNSSYTWKTGSITHPLEINESTNVSSFFQRSLYCDIKSIRVLNSTIKFNDLKHLVAAGNVERIYLYEATVLNNNGDISLIDDIIDLTPKLRRLYLIGRIFQCVTGGIVAKKLLETNLNCIRFHEIPESFDFQSFVDIIKKMTNVQIDFWFHESVSDEHVIRVKNGCPNIFERGIATEIRLMSSSSRVFKKNGIFISCKKEAWRNDFFPQTHFFKRNTLEIERDPINP